MAFMQNEISFGDWYEIDTTHGTWWVQAEYISEEALTDDRGCDMVEGEVTAFVLHKQCWGARLSAPGYLDCTEWCAGFSSPEEAEAYLIETYGDEEEESPEEGERTTIHALFTSVDAQRRIMPEHIYSTEDKAQAALVKIVNERRYKQGVEVFDLQPNRFKYMLGNAVVVFEIVPLDVL